MKFKKSPLSYRDCFWHSTYLYTHPYKETDSKVEVLMRSIWDHDAYYTLDGKEVNDVLHDDIYRVTFFRIEVDRFYEELNEQGRKNNGSVDFNLSDEAF